MVAHAMGRVVGQSVTQSASCCGVPTSNYVQRLLRWRTWQGWRPFQFRNLQAERTPPHRPPHSSLKTPDEFNIMVCVSSCSYRAIRRAAGNNTRRLWMDGMTDTWM